MASHAWIVRATDGETVTGYWDESSAEEYTEDHPGEGLTVVRIDVP